MKTLVATNCEVRRERRHCARRHTVRKRGHKHLFVVAHEGDDTTRS
jgi:hypothetical protein